MGITFQPMGNIFTNQNKIDNISHLVAQRHCYDISKSWQTGRTIGNIIVSIIGSLISFFFPVMRSTIILIGIFWGVISFILKLIIGNKIKEAATIQEQFDINLYGISWNGILIEKKIPLETINSLAKTYKGDRKSLNNWYPNTGGIPRPIDILICQKANLAWDEKLHSSFAVVVIILISVLAAITLAIAYFTKTSVQDYFIVFISPSIGILMQIIEIIKEHLEISRIKANLHNLVSTLIDNAIKKKNISVTRCRKIQDQIFLLRTKEATIPNFWYRLSRSRYEDDMNSTVKILKERWRKSS